MISRGNAPTADQKRWREIVRDYGSVISRGPAVIHHCCGVTGSHRKVKLGHSWILPLTDAEHKDLHNGRTFGYESRKEFEKAKFQKMCVRLVDDYLDEYFPSEEVCEVIQGYHR